MTAATQPTVIENKQDFARLELYRLIGEGYKAAQEGRVSTLEEVKERIAYMRANRE